jgi:DNA polymerase-3 subunit epsilon
VIFRSSPPWDAIAWWALDLETGGLDAKHDAILQVAMVPVRDGRIRMAEQYTTMVRPSPGAAVKAPSVRAHGFVPADVRDAPPLSEVLPEVARRLAGAGLVVHHAAVDVAFLEQAFRREKLRWPAPPVADTARLLLAHARREQRRHPELPGDAPALDLGAARARFGLPEYPAHDARSDAVAAAELFLVLVRALGARTVRDLRG